MRKPPAPKLGGFEEQGIGLDELGGIGVREIVGSSEIEVGVVQSAGDGAALFVGGFGRWHRRQRCC